MKDSFVLPKNQDYKVVMDEMLNKAHDIALQCEDYTVDNSFTVTPHKVGFYGKEFDLSDYATYQLCSKVGVPSGYFSRDAHSTDEELVELAYHNIAVHLKKHKGEFLMRTYGDMVRGVLTPRYSIFDADQVLDIASNTITQMVGADSIAIRGYFQDYETLHARFTDVNPIKGIGDKDLYTGFTIDTSDVGKSILRVRFFIYKQVCTNGLCLSVFDNELVAKKHIGKSSYDFAEDIKRSFQRLPIVASRAVELIARAENTKVNDKFFLLTEDKQEETDERKGMMRYFGFKPKQMNEVIELANRNYGHSLWGYANAITEFAQKENFDRRLELETLAGDLITRPYRLGIRVA